MLFGSAMDVIDRCLPDKELAFLAINSTISAPVVVSNLAPDVTLTGLVGAEHLPR